MEKDRENFAVLLTLPVLSAHLFPGLTQPLADQFAPGDDKSSPDICRAETFKCPAHLEQAWQINPPEGPH